MTMTHRSNRIPIKYKDVPDSDIVAILDYFLTNKNNTVVDISKALNIDDRIVNWTINRYLDNIIKKK